MLDTVIQTVLQGEPVTYIYLFSYSDEEVACICMSTCCDFKLIMSDDFLIMSYDLACSCLISKLAKQTGNRDPQPNNKQTTKRTSNFWPAQDARNHQVIDQNELVEPATKKS